MGRYATDYGRAMTLAERQAKARAARKVREQQTEGYRRQLAYICDTIDICARRGDAEAQAIVAMTGIDTPEKLYGYWACKETALRPSKAKKRKQGAAKEVQGDVTKKAARPGKLLAASASPGE